MGCVPIRGMVASAKMPSGTTRAAAQGTIAGGRSSGVGHASVSFRTQPSQWEVLSLTIVNAGA